MFTNDLNTTKHTINFVLHFVIIFIAIMLKLALMYLQSNVKFLLNYLM